MSKTVASNTNVPDKLFAFVLQATHILYALITAPRKSIITAEVIDDIAIQTPDVNIPIQVKAPTSKNNPVANHAVDLWKTFSNWITYVNENEIDLNTTYFKLFVASNMTGGLVSLFSAANSPEMAAAAYEKAKNEFYGQNNVAKSIAKYIEVCFCEVNKEIMLAIIMNFKLENITTDYYTWILTQFSEIERVPPDLQNALFTHMIGWVNESILVKQGKPVFIAVDDYIEEYKHAYKAINNKYMLYELGWEPTEDDIGQEQKAFKKYIKQLELINCEQEDVLIAINNYLKSCIHRTEWAISGHVTEQTYIKYSNELYQKWRTYRGVSLIDSDNDINSGKKIYFTCMNDDIDCNGMGVPYFFTPGCYHILAEELRIGWHPNYKDLIGKEDESE